MANITIDINKEVEAWVKAELSKQSSITNVLIDILIEHTKYVYEDDILSISTYSDFLLLKEKIVKFLQSLFKVPMNFNPEGILKRNPLTSPGYPNNIMPVFTLQDLKGGLHG